MIDTPNPKYLWQLAPENFSNPQRIRSSCIIYDSSLAVKLPSDQLFNPIQAPLKTNFYMWKHGCHQYETTSYAKPLLSRYHKHHVTVTYNCCLAVGRSLSRCMESFSSALSARKGCCDLSREYGRGLILYLTVLSWMFGIVWVYLSNL